MTHAPVEIIRTKIAAVQERKPHELLHEGLPQQSRGAEAPVRRSTRKFRAARAHTGMQLAVQPAHVQEDSALGT